MRTIKRLLSLAVVLVASCQLPLTDAGSSKGGLTLNFVISGTGTSRTASASRLLLPTATSLVVTLNPVAQGYPVLTRAVNLGSGTSVVKVNFGQVDMGTYAVQAQAADNSGVVQFQQTGTLNLTSTTNSITLNLVPVSFAAPNQLTSGQTVSGTLPLGGASSWSIPPSALVSGGWTLTLTVDPSVQLFAQDSDGALFPASATIGSVTTVQVKGPATSFVTLYNSGAVSQPYTFVLNAPISVTGVSLNPATLGLAAGGATGTLTPTIAPANATNKNVTWSSSNTSVATVSTTGVVSPLSAGTATITVTTTDGGKTATCVVTVAPAPVAVTSVVASPGTATLYVVTAPTTTLSATVLPVNATNPAVTWSSSTPGVATVNPATGLVTAVAPGTSAITATTADGGFTSVCVVTVLGQGNPSVTFDLGTFQTLSFSSTNLTIPASSPLLIAPSGGTLASAGTGWNWYVNSVSTGVATASYTFNNPVPGFYTVDVTVNYGGVLYSGSVNVTVTQ